MFWWQAHDTRKRYAELKRKHPNAVILLESGDDIFLTYDDSAEFLKSEFKALYYINAKGQPGLSVPRARLSGRIEKLDTHAWKLKKSTHEPVTAKRAEQKPSVIPFIKPRQTEQVPASSCDNCQLRKSGKCSQLRNQLCGDYLAIPYISNEEKGIWPEHGDATAFRLGEKRE